MSGEEGKTSSRYSLMTEESVTTTVPCTSVGTTPLGLSCRYQSCRCSFSRRLTMRSVWGSPFSARASRTFWLQVEVGVL